MRICTGLAENVPDSVDLGCFKWTVSSDATRTYLGDCRLTFPESDEPVLLDRSKNSHNEKVSNIIYQHRKPGNFKELLTTVLTRPCAYF